MADERDQARGYASPACSAHEVDEAYVLGPGAPMDREAVARWRRAERERLIAARRAVPADKRAEAARAVAEELDRLVTADAGTVVSVYWPFRGELDLRDWLGEVIRRGGRAALPVVVEKARPLVFREWTPGAKMARGVWNIPVPAEGAEVTPNVVIAPLVGFDPECYRLGYGGGFFDRTLAALPRPRLVVGVGLTQAEIPTIHPQPHDVPMDLIVTEDGRPRWREGREASHGHP